MEVWPVEFAVGKGACQPLERFLVADVHSKGDLSLLAIAPEVAFANQEANDVAFIEGLELGTFHGKHDGETVLRLEAAGIL